MRPLFIFPGMERERAWLMPPAFRLLNFVRKKIGKDPAPNVTLNPEHLTHAEDPTHTFVRQCFILPLEWYTHIEWHINSYLAPTTIHNPSLERTLCQPEWFQLSANSRLVQLAFQNSPFVCVAIFLSLLLLNEYSFISLRMSCSYLDLVKEERI